MVLSYSSVTRSDTWARLALSFLGLGLAAACSPNPSTEEPCDAPEPAFEVQVTASGGGELPEGTSVNVVWGGNLTETYVLAEKRAPKVVCCEPSTEPMDGQIPRVPCTEHGDLPDAGAARAILCSLWTGSGTPTVTISAGGFVTLKQDLDSRYRENRSCGVETVQARLTLGRPEGGL